MAESKLKRVTENENQDFTVEPPNKKRKESSDLLKKFKCKYFYIDKSLLIKEFLQDDSEIVCVTRPSGFGKTTNLTMLRYFFEMSYENIKENEFQNLRNKKYFENLLISKEKEDDQTYLDKYQGKYPVIYIDFSSAFKIEKTFEATIESYKSFIKKLFRSYKNINLKNLDKYDKEQWENFQSGIFSLYELKESISFLCLSLNKAFNKNIILLIDNYDSPILNTVNTSFYNKFYKFYDEVFLEIFNQDKRHHYLFKTFITRNLNKIPILMNYEMLKKDYIEKHREIIWTLLVGYGYLIYDYRTVTTNFDFKIVKLEIRTNDVSEFIKNKLSSWKQNLCKDEKIKNTIDSLTRNYDEERIIEFLKDKIKSNLGYGTGYDYYENEFLDKYYSIIYSLLSLSDECEVVTKKKFNENDNIRELLIIPKKNLKSNNNKNDIVYIIINYNDIVKEGCIEALDYNENLEFDDIKLKEKYDKIIKFGIAFKKEYCDVIYEINYGNCFKKKEMQKEIYTGEEFQYASNKNFYLIDKTKMISKLINHEEIIAYLITRPRRFGKSLNLSMIKEFFEKPINEIENEDKKFVFDGLEVSKDRKNMRHFHKYPVIYLNFKGIQGNNFKEIKNFLIDIISTLFKNMRNKIEFEKLGDLDKRNWIEIENKNNTMLLSSTLSFMCSCLKKFYKRRCIILIDEYDKVLINSKRVNVFDKVQPIIEGIFSSTFKKNTNLYFGVITGCYSFGLSSSNSGANNITKCTLLNDLYFSDCYGFTEDELKNVLSHFNISDSKEKSDDIEDGIKERLRKKYGGYSCVSNIGIIKNIYNPYSVMKFVQKNKNKRDNFELSNYWIYSEKNEKLKNLLKNSLVTEQESGYGIIDIGFPNEKEKKKKCLIEMKVNDENIKEYEDNEDDNKI
ncbi:hypothetical protein H8356DRAFT_1278505 [Neocallimastix lanati (nom. inval.)]|uniref:AAA-ATPase-like domain-containing protein n=1 Tax=Neocallimastix californiae TaxID=1754190 RepID=A0A1Y2AGU1_9FUNG|nr:hypothetical protein H8356DRAFT_1278505 [Neocallimastix sp. JGI-2020a]ORY21828.1 hypothetical protein LY90DRAFT_515878 [Neocallimastix californiae]|eukprot:ORY21828.1 hypothetical protein LY90DRAFT_515878 [Neocallimastix californiae]